MVASWKPGKNVTDAVGIGTPSFIREADWRRKRGVARRGPIQMLRSPVGHKNPVPAGLPFPEHAMGHKAAKIVGHQAIGLANAKPRRFMVDDPAAKNRAVPWTSGTSAKA